MKLIVEFESVEELAEFVQWKKLNDEKKAARIGKTLICDAHWLDARTANILKAEGIEFIEDAMAMHDWQLLRIPNFGRASLRHLREKHNALAQADAACGVSPGAEC